MSKNNRAAKKAKKKVKVGRPQQGDRSDMRCAFVVDRKGAHDDVDEKDWCFGCKFYVCDSCEGHNAPMGSHDVVEHEAWRTKAWTTNELHDMRPVQEASGW